MEGHISVFMCFLKMFEHFNLFQAQINNFLLKQVHFFFFFGKEEGKREKPAHHFL